MMTIKIPVFISMFALMGQTPMTAPMQLPDPQLTPGKVASTQIEEVCLKENNLTYSKRHRTWHDKHGTLGKYNIPLLSSNKYEDDDRVPVCLGGDNQSLLNHWPELWSEAHQKDKLEVLACRLVCIYQISLAEAQGWFLGDWRTQLWRINQ